MMQKPAMRKWVEIMRSAGTPMATIVSDAENISSRGRGKKIKSTTPTAMRHSAAATESLKAERMRLRFPAP